MSIVAALPEFSWSLIALGLAAGLLSAMLGVGSGILLVPALVLIIGLPQKSAQGTALAVMVPMALVGAARYAANPNIDISFMRVALLSAGAIVGALIGAAIAARVPGIVLRRIFAAFLLIVAVRMMLPTRAKRPLPAAALNDPLPHDDIDRAP
ncbi:MAG: sulfite exporter TauE/SafE family protein [Verrucomicrobia bacterium]|jgi:uncharacterized protein|nr:sulfite exporter TauE/SafE family protein [Verrucomicrobiota bacterium]MBT7066718.1 sulfite exporter TauE/SafE family protein [Verrucomicrobiota bacterium]MBT7700791.1 sulfite exporter TauE/SafE family protein [Verrucomicrobiota bacterium]